MSVTFILFNRLEISFENFESYLRVRPQEKTVHL